MMVDIYHCSVPWHWNRRDSTLATPYMSPSCIIPTSKLRIRSQIYRIKKKSLATKSGLGGKQG